MNKRLLMIVSVALLVAAAASWFVYRTVTVRMATGGPRPTAKVVVAAKNLDVGTLIRQGDVSLGDWIGPLPKGSFNKIEDVVNRGVISPIYQGEPILENRLAKPGAGGGLAATIPPGMRACAVKVNEVVGLAGFVVPGMRVDVLVTGNPPGVPSSQGPVTKTILQNVEVLSAGQNIQKDAEGRPVQVQVVNLLVTPEQAEILSLASNESKIQLVLRNPLDTEQVKTDGSSLAKLFLPERSISPPPPIPTTRAPARAPRPQAATPTMPPPIKPIIVPAVHRVEVINGPKREKAEFEKSEQEKKSQEAEEVKK